MAKKKSEPAGAGRGHHPSLPDHRTMDQAIRAVPVVLALAQGGEADFADAVQAVAVVVDYGSQHFHKGFALESAAQPLSQEEAVKHLEAFASTYQGREGKLESAAAIPWQVLVPIVMEIFMKWWQSRK